MAAGGRGRAVRQQGAQGCAQRQRLVARGLGSTAGGGVLGLGSTVQGLGIFSVHSLSQSVKDDFRKKFMTANSYFEETIGEEGEYKDKKKKYMLFDNEFSVLFYL
ncbi:uncharacterized protein LOC133833981 [Humulus lupulus]|uniref:uncharacterized protein LOC133833981 n=1 Tax=Humulus lupulus TaxID=3486 RepID=UPI002B418039|nr:uncharacterized protein LOC133833981 [Humulus lupulus]